MSELPPCAVLRSLESATAAYPLDRKLLVCRSVGEGRELLRALAVRGGSWLGWEVTTPRRLALDRVAPALAEAGLGVADPYDEEAALDAALDGVLEADAGGALRELGEAAGFREAVANAIRALRIAAVDPARLRATPAPNPGVRDLLAAVLTAYEAALQAACLLDTADILRRAARDLEGGSGSPGDRVFLLSGLGLRGAAGELVRALVRSGARVLAADPVALPTPEGVLWRADGAEAPLSRILDESPGPAARPEGVQLQLLAASGPAEEVREVLRRAAAALQKSTRPSRSTAVIASGEASMSARRWFCASTSCRCEARRFRSVRRASSAP